MPQKTQTYKLDYFKQGSYYSAFSDLKRFVTMDYNLDSYVGVVGVGIISGWTIKGLGDQVCSEPVIRFMRKNIYKTEDITVVTHWPRLFKHLKNVNVYSHDEFMLKRDTPYYHVISLPGPETIMWTMVSHLLCHCVDYISMAILKRILPNIDKQIKLDVYPEEIKEVEDIVKCDLKDLILVHPGRHWESKTFPVKYWQDIVDGLKENGYTLLHINRLVDFWTEVYTRP